MSIWLVESSATWQQAECSWLLFAEGSLRMHELINLQLHCKLITPTVWALNQSGCTSGSLGCRYAPSGLERLNQKSQSN